MGVSWNPFSLLLNADVERDNARSEEVSASLQKAVTFIAAGAFHKVNKAMSSHLSFADWRTGTLFFDNLDLQVYEILCKIELQQSLNLGMQGKL